MKLDFVTIDRIGDWRHPFDALKTTRFLFYDSRHEERRMNTTHKKAEIPFERMTTGDKIANMNKRLKAIEERFVNEAKPTDPDQNMEQQKVPAQPVGDPDDTSKPCDETDT